MSCPSTVQHAAGTMDQTASPLLCWQSAPPAHKQPGLQVDCRDGCCLTPIIFRAVGAVENAPTASHLRRLCRKWTGLSCCTTLTWQKKLFPSCTEWETSSKAGWEVDSQVGGRQFDFYSRWKHFSIARAKEDRLSTTFQLIRRTG